jgi:hypothetical protein
MREHLLPGLLLAPFVMTCAPLTGVAALAILQGQSPYPFSLPAATPESTASMFGAVTVIASALVAAIGAFWVFRSEIATRAVNFFFLARHPRVVSVVSSIYGGFIGMGAYAIARTAIILLTGSPQPRAAKELAIAALSVAIGSTLGSLLVAISSEAAILVVVYAVVVGSSAALLQSADRIRVAIALVLAAGMLQAATGVLRRRCAS